MVQVRNVAVALLLAFNAGATDFGPASEVNAKLDFMTKIYLNLPNLFRSNLSVADNAIACLKNPASQASVFKWDSTQNKWIEKSVSCKRVIEVIVKNPLDSFFKKMRIQLALSESSRRPSHWRDFASSDLYILRRDIQHSAEWKFFGTGLKIAQLVPLSPVEVNSAKQLFGEHLIKICLARGEAFLKTWNHFSEKKLFFFDCKKDPTKLKANLDSKGFRSMSPEIEKQWQAVLRLSMDEFHESYRQAYFRIIQSLPYILSVKEYNVYGSFDQFIGDQKQVTSLVGIIADLRSRHLRATEKFMRFDSENQILERTHAIGSMGDQEKQRLYLDLLQVFSNFSGDLARTLGREFGLETVAAAQSDLQKVEDRNDLKKLAWSLGGLGLCLLPQAKVLGFVGRVARLTKGYSSTLLGSALCLGTTVVINGSFMLGTYSDLHDLIDDASNFSPDDRLADSSKLESMLKSLNPILLFF
jgi:hypothetical protein